MFPKKLYGDDTITQSKVPNPQFPQFRLDDYGYGKENVRVMALLKDGAHHSIKEYSVTSHLKLLTHKEYYEADNTDIIGSDVQEVTIFLHARKFGLLTPEEFALSLTKHFLDTYPIVAESHVRVEEKPWDRLNGNHNHAFVMTPIAIRSCDVVRKRSETDPLVMGAIEQLRVIKTAQAPFVGYIKAGLHTEGDQPDRVLCAELNAKWQYSRIEGINFAQNWYEIKDLLLQSFAGDPKVGITTTSVQSISYESEILILNKMPQISSVMVSLPNIRYLPYNYSRFKESPPNIKNLLICEPADVPNGIGFSKLDRLDMEK